MIITARNAPEKENSQLHFIAGLSKAEGAQKVTREVLSKNGRLDILVNNLGSSATPARGFASLTDTDWENTPQANLLALIPLHTEFLPQMIEKKVVNNLRRNRACHIITHWNYKDMTHPTSIMLAGIRGNL